MEKQYDIVLFGATGFTGQLTAEYLQHASGDFKWAVAGRSASKLQAVVEQYAPNAEVVVADVADQASIQAMVDSTRVVITTVGPYMQYGEPLIKACAESGTHYVDLTGEPTFVYRMLAKYQDVAERSGAKIVNCCGFDSIPYDLGVQYAVECLAEQLNVDGSELDKVEVDGFIRASGAASGGTWHSALGIIGDLEASKTSKRDVKDIFEGLGGRNIRRPNNGLVRNKQLKRWGVPLPTIDPEVVSRSAAEDPAYGKDFQYNHYASVKRLPTILVSAAGLGAIAGIAQFGLGRRLLGKVIEPGEGPSAEQREKNWFQLTLLAESNGQQVHCKVSGGDPGYGDTSKMLAESALSLALDEDNGRSGFLTPALAMGVALRDRLHQTGIRFTQE